MRSVSLAAFFDPSLVALPVTPCEIQGQGFSSPYQGQLVQVSGVVAADLDETGRRGFTLQLDTCDQDPITSDGVFVYLGQRADVVQAGDWVVVEGKVQEYYGLTEVVSSAEQVVRQAAGYPLPPTVELAPPMDDSARSYFEALESMRVHLDQGLVVGPTDRDDRTWLLSAAAGRERVFADDPSGTNGILCVDDRGAYELSPEARTGQQVNGLEGALNYALGVYCLDLTQPPQLVAYDGPAPAAAPGSSVETWRLATVNLENLFDNQDDPATEDSVLSGPEYQRRLAKRAALIRAGLGQPDLVAVQEVESLAVLTALAQHPEISVPYAPVVVEGPDVRGLDVGLLYRQDRAQLLSVDQMQGCTALVDGLGPDGNHDMDQPANLTTCDVDGDGRLDGNRLFSRPPLLARLIVCPSGCENQPQAQLVVIVNHWKSHLEDDGSVAYTLPRRVEQGRFVSQLVADVQLNQPALPVMVLGDLNDSSTSPAVAQLAAAGMQNQWLWLPAELRYSYIYHGLSQALDYLWYQPGASSGGLRPLSAGAVHWNADYPEALAGQTDSLYRASDHDPLIVSLGWQTPRLFLPLSLH